MNKNEIVNPFFSLEDNLYLNEDNYFDLLYEKNETNSQINENTTQYVSKEREIENVLKEDNSVKEFSRNSEIKNNPKKLKKNAVEKQLKIMSIEKNTTNIQVII